MTQVSSITQAIQAAGLTPTGLTDLLLNVDEGHSARTTARITVILDGLCNLPLVDGRKILTATAAQAKGKPTEQTVKQRVSECRQLFGAARLIDGFRKGINDAGMGWASSVSRARVELASKGLKANGDVVKSKEVIAQEKAHNVMVSTMAENMVGVDTSDEGAVAEAARRAAGFTNTHGASPEMIRKRAESIVKDNGMDYAVALSDALVALYNASIEDEQPEQAQA